MRLRNLLTALLLAAAVAVATPSAHAVDTSSASIQLRANQAFDQGQYAQALPMLQKVESQLKDDPKQADNLAMVQEKIRVCQKNTPVQLASAQLASPTPAVAPPVSAAAVTSVGPSTALPNTPPADPLTEAGPNRIPHPAPKPGQVLDLAIKQLGNFEYDAEKGGNIPADVLRLQGATIKLHGFMIPMDQAENISQFALVPSLFACCYGQPPQIQHTIVVQCPKGKAVSYYPDEIVVQGTLDVKEKKDDGFIVSIFDMQASSVKPAAK